MMPSQDVKMYLVEKFKWRYHLLHTLGYVLNWCCDECVFPCVCVEWMYPIDSVHRNCEAFGSVHTVRYKEYKGIFAFRKISNDIEGPEGKNRMGLIQIEWKGVNGCLLQLFDWKWFFFLSAMNIDGSSISNDTTPHWTGTKEYWTWEWDKRQKRHMPENRSAKNNMRWESTWTE